MYGQQVTQGIKYIKVSKIDKEGNNNSQNLQTANKLRINYPDIGVQEYLIQTSQNFADYYLFGVIPNDNTSSINEILDYSVEASYSDPGGTDFATPLSPTGLKDLLTGIGATSGVVTGNLLGYYTSSGADNTTITFGNTPNIDINFTLSGSVLNNTGGDQTIKLFLLDVKSSEFSDSPIAESIITVPTNGSPQDFEIPLTLSSSYNIVEGQSYSFQIQGSSNSVIIQNSPGEIIFLFTGSIPPVSTTETLVTIEPTYDFQFSDYNILNGNIDIARTSIQYLDVDYSSGVLTPNNITTIISGTATPAPIQDSNYTLQRNIRPRYNGSRSSSPDFNITV